MNWTARQRNSHGRYFGSAWPDCKAQIEKEVQDTNDAALRTRCLVIHNLDNGYRPTHVAEILMISRTTVYRVAKRYAEHGLDGLRDFREGNGQRKVTPEYLEDLREAVKESPQDYDWPRPTWARELLIGTMEQLEYPSIHPTTMSVALQSIEARLGRPKPIVLCPRRELSRRLCINTLR